MAKNYTIKDFFRQMPNALLMRYFETHDIAHGLDLASLPEAKADPWVQVWDTVPDTVRAEIEADFRDIYSVSSEKGAAAMYDELLWQMQRQPEEAQALLDKLADLSNHYERAMVVFLDHKDCWRGATRFYHADTLSSWRKRKGLPKKDATVDDASLKQFSDLIGGYFQRHEGRGKHCAVEAFRRGERDYFFAYPEDHSQRAVEWVEGEFKPRPHNPAFEVVFVYSKVDGGLDISFKGEKKTVEAMQGIFAQAILKLEELPPDPKDPRVYDLEPLVQKAFEFEYSPTSGIEHVQLKKMRLSSIAKKGERITLEADTTKDEDALHSLLDTLKKVLPMHLYRVTQVEITAHVRVTPDKPAKKVSFRITHPNSCSLKYDELEEKVRVMLEASGIEPRLPESAEYITEPQPAAA